MSGSDDGKLFDQDLSDFLGDSDDFDFESIAPPSRAMTRQGSIQADGRLRGLESIYL